MNDSLTPLRIGLVGVGTHGRQAVIPAFETSRFCRLVAVADHREDLAPYAGREFRCYQSLDAMLENEELDVLYIATLPESHCELALKAFRNGLHVICEKPIAASADEAEQTVNAAEEAGKELIVMFENRVLPAYRKIKEWIQSGVIGRVEAIQIQQLGKHPQAQPRRTHLLNAAGCLDCGIHMLDLVCFWLGGGAWQETWFNEEVEFAPHVAALARLDNRVMVTLDASFSYGLRVEHLDYRFKKQGLSIVGTEGLIREIGDPCAGFEVLSNALTSRCSFPMFRIATTSLR